MICVPLRAGQRNVGTIALGSSHLGATYSAGDLKLLNTIALQAAAAIENALLCAAMVETARERAAYAAELQAASTVQQLLLQSASQATPGFGVDSVYLPASEVGGDFFFVAPAPDGSITAIVGDVSGKGLTAAMRVAMILGALRRETSHEPGDILAALNNVLIAQGQLGFTTACCVRIALSGEYTLANAGHVSPYLSGRELSTPPALPLGLVPDQVYASVQGSWPLPSALFFSPTASSRHARPTASSWFRSSSRPHPAVRPTDRRHCTALRSGRRYHRTHAQPCDAPHSVPAHS